MARARDEFSLPAAVVANVRERTQKALATTTTTSTTATASPTTTTSPSPSASTGPAPFLTRPYIGWHSLNSYFDHCNPDYTVDYQLCTVDGLVAKKSNGYDPNFPKGYAATPGGTDYVYYDGHNGFDLGLSYEPLLAAAPGTVEIAGIDSVNPCFGLNVVIDHGNGYSTRYAHMSRVDVTIGQKLTRGEQIGISGTTGCSTGPHLHFGLYTTNPWNAIDPWGWLGPPGADPYPYDTGDMWLSGNPQDPFPQAPAAPVAVLSGTSATITWTPGFDGGEAITSYTVAQSPGGAVVQVPGSQTQATFLGLLFGTAYTFTVTAQNSEGVSAASAPTNSVTPVVPILSAVQNSSYHLDTANDGLSWVEIDAGLDVPVTPAGDGSAVVTGSIDLWTATAGYNQDVGVFVSTDAGPDVLQSWKESGGLVGTFSPNAALVQAVVPVQAGHSYVFKLKWKPNRAAPGGTIFAGAGSAGTQFSPTRLTVRLLPGAALSSAVQNVSYHLDGANDGGFSSSSWVAVDPALDVAMVGVETTVQVTANMDLWATRPGYGVDLGLFVNDSANPGAGDQLLAWKESGFVGTFSPNAAFVIATYPTHGGHNYTFRLKWKPNRAAPGGTLYGAAGTAATQFSPTRLSAEQMAPGSFQAATQNVSYHIDAPSTGDFHSWVELNPQDRVTITPGASSQAFLTGNIDLWTSSAGYNQDIAIFACDATVADCTQFANLALIGWKESGGYAGTYSPNAATVQAVLRLTAGHAYTFALGWKPNRAAPGGVVYGGAGTALTQFSPTTLLLQLGS